MSFEKIQQDYQRIISPVLRPPTREVYDAFKDGVDWCIDIALMGDLDRVHMNFVRCVIMLVSTFRHYYPDYLCKDWSWCITKILTALL